MKLSNKSLFAASVLSTSLLAFGCAESDNNPDTRADNAASTVDNSVQDAKDAIESYADAMEARVAEAGDKLDDAKSRLGNLNEEFREEINESMADADTVKQEITESIGDIRSESVEEWSGLKAEAELLWKDYENRVDSIVMRVNDQHVDEYTRQAKQRIAAFDDQLAKVEDRLKDIPDNVRTQVEYDMKEVKNLKDEYNEKLAQINDAPSNEWSELKDEAEDLEDELELKVDDIVASVEDELDGVDFSRVE